MSIEKIIENIDAMRALFKKYGFENVRLFKGFGGMDEKAFCLSLSVQPGQKEGLVAQGKRQKLEEKLKEMLGFYVNIAFKESIRKNYLEEISKPSGSIDLSDSVETTVFRTKLENYFGKEWEFAKTDPYEPYKLEQPPTAEMLSFPKTLAHPVFGKPSLPNGLSSESLKKVEDNMRELSSKFSELTPDELISLREKLAQAIDQKLSELDLRKKI